MSLLFQPLELQNHTLKNRMVVSPMCQYSAENGFATNWHLVHLGQFAIGKAGLIMQEATAVVPEGRITYGDLGLWNDAQIPALKNIVDFVHSQGSLIGIQLAHAGRKASTNKPWINRNQFLPEHENGWQTVGVSTLPYHQKDHPPVALTKQNIQEIIQAFKQSAQRAVTAGYNVVELHAAHGYLIHQFFSPLINNRSDEYGGSFENRIRFLLEIVEQVQQVLTNQSLWVRISATDWAEGGWTCFESVKLAHILKQKNVEVIDVSTGGAVAHQQIPEHENYQVPFANRIKTETNMITGAVGLITHAKQAEAILQKKEADFVSIARGFLQNPHLVYDFANELNVAIDWAPQYERGKESF
ncbi:NADH:flavin oxidoreductase/NADH oxidase [Paenimyroides aestuarii]|uniref:NADH:flavin oxidoreductase/NADH oxidase n=1 Tax=Paenimyroides aestuarii TaxID=2968490 RepID=A0ABY5NVS6_9FLAO|nr:NADH:flavin oxidoreductase/NADH oxidase [Paenimyroides aestuarii]UUV22700.1 NADH:flavin oxidoreductase/NADH oxidase [Paenimyroides aestuarii]